MFKPNIHMPRRLRRSAGATFLAVVIGGLLFPLAEGCNSHRSNNWVLIPRKKSTSEFADMALESKDADTRRRGVEGLAASPDASLDWAVKVFDTIARTDSDPMVRSAALRALEKTAGAEQLRTAITVLTSNVGKGSKDVRPAPPRVRWSAARLLLAFMDERILDADQRKTTLDVVLQHLKVEDDRTVRLSLIDTLAYFSDQQSVKALIDQLDDEDYAIQHAAELALVSLTGVTHHHDSAAWRQWLNDTPDPFAQAGQIPEEMQANREKPKWDWGSGD